MALSQDAVETIQNAYFQFKYKDVLTLSREALNRDPALSVAQQVEIFTYRAFANIALGNGDDARGDFFHRIGFGAFNSPFAVDGASNVEVASRGFSLGVDFSAPAKPSICRGAKPAFSRGAKPAFAPGAKPGISRVAKPAIS